jgi:hypothetical protein
MEPGPNNPSAPQDRKNMNDVGIVGYEKSIWPVQQEIAKRAAQNKADFAKQFVSTGEVKYLNDKELAALKADKKNTMEPQDVDDLYGALTSFCYALPANQSDREKKAMLKMGLDEYKRKEPKGQAYVKFCAERGGPQRGPQSAVQWFTERQLDLNNLVRDLEWRLSGWNTA